MLKALIVAVVFVVTPLFAQDTLPNGPGKEVAVRACTQCHGADQFSELHKSSRQWEDTITAMQSRGLTISDDDFTVVLDYLTKNLGPVPKKININKATAGELERRLGLTTKQSVAIVQYREKNGPIKDLDELKKINDLDPAALDVKKNLLEF